MKDKRFVLLVLTAEVVLSFVLKTFGGSLSELLYRSMDALFAALAIGLMLHLTRWNVPLKSHMKVLPSLFFIFGAFMGVMILGNIWTDFLRALNPVSTKPILPGLDSIPA
jgi:hypothetical protein